MPRLRLLIAVVLLAVLVACRREVPKLDDVQRVAYSVKPAVVRISAYATAEFRYTSAQLRSLETALRVRAGSAGEMRDWLGRVVTRLTADLSSTEALSRLAVVDSPGDELGALLDGPVLEYIRRNGLYMALDRI